jgi:RecB family exonuclease
VASGWLDRLVELSRRGGQRGRAADRDLDAIVALFEAVARVEDRQPKVGVQVLLDELEAQEIPSSSRNEGGGLDAGAVRLLTAHRSKGLEWDLVVVAGVNDGIWPDLRRRSSVLEADRLGRDGVVEPAGRAQLLVDERRLFYVAVTRARRRLVVTAVSSRDETGTQPSRFVEDLCVDALGMETLPPVEKVGDQLLSPSALVGRVRRVAVAEAGDAVRRHAATVLARLAQPLPDGRRAVAAAHPARWWGLRDRTEGPGPVRPPDQPVRLSASAVKGYDECPLAWFLGREVGASGPSGPSQGFGVVLHALAKLVSSGELPPDLDVLDAQLDKVWNALGFEARWHAAQERERAREALARFLDWHAANPYEHVGSEVEFRKVRVAGAELTGSIDRVDRDADGRLVLVDYKTGKSEVSQEAAEEDLQLGVYQVVAEEGGLGGGPAEVAGASLVYLRKPHQDDVLTTRRQPGRADWPEDFAGRAVARAVTGILAEEFPARPNKNCQHCAFANSCPAQDEGRQVVE